MAEKNFSPEKKLSPEIREIFENLVAAGTITDVHIKKIVSKYGGRSGNSFSKASSEDLKSLPVGISYPESLKVWGADLAQQEKAQTIYSPAKFREIAAEDESPGWKTFWSGGMSIMEMAAKYPEEIIVNGWAKYAWWQEKEPSGYIIASWENKFIDLPEHDENKVACGDASRLSGRCLVELLIGLKLSGQTFPNAYFRTELEDRKGRKISIGFRDNKIHFTSQKGGKYKSKIRLFMCLKERTAKQSAS